MLSRCVLSNHVGSEVLYVDPHPSQFHFLGRLGLCLEPCAVDDPKFMGVAEHEKLDFGEDLRKPKDDLVGISI